MLSRTCASCSSSAPRGGGAMMMPTAAPRPTSLTFFSLASSSSQLSPRRLVPPSVMLRGRCSLVTRRRQSAQGDCSGAAAATTTTTRTPPTPTTTTAAAKTSEKFDWRRCWYPVALVESLKTDRPNALQLLGEPLVAWKPLQGVGRRSGSSGGNENESKGESGSVVAAATEAAWVVQRDACPHRLAPLSEGRLETDGTLQCAYHGWRFAPSGRLTLVPQLVGADPAAHARACGVGDGGSGGGRGCVALHPSRVVDGVLWAWAEAGGADVAARAAAAPPSSLPPEMLPTPLPGAPPPSSSPPAASAPPTPAWRANALGWYTRDMPLPMEMIVENFLDASHIPFSHHGVMGDRDAPDHSIAMAGVGAAAIGRAAPRPTTAATGVKGGGGGQGQAGAAAAAGAAATTTAATTTTTTNPTTPTTTPAEAEAAAARVRAAKGLSVRVRPPGGRPAYGLSFVPPGLVRYDFGGVAMLLHVTPTSPGRSRIFLTVIEPPPPSSRPKPPPPLLPPLARLGRLMAWLDPRTLKNRWIPLYHAFNRNAALDGDAMLLYKAQELLQRGGGAGWGGGGGAVAAGAGAGVAAGARSAPGGVAAGADAAAIPATTAGHGVDWRRLYYMPASADLAVAAWRRWLDGPGSEMPLLPANAASLGLGPPSPAAPLSRLEVFDRYHQHTRHCPHCMRALAACNWALGALALAGLAAFTLAVWFGAAATSGGASAAASATAAASTMAARAAASAGVSALCAWAATALWRLRMLFIVHDYQHAER